MLERGPPAVIRGAESWRWYWQYLRDPLASFQTALDRYGPVVAFGLDLPVSKERRRRTVLALGAPYNREVLGQPYLFRPGGQVLRGPKGSAHRRIRKGIFAMHSSQHR